MGVGEAFGRGLRKNPFYGGGMDIFWSYSILKSYYLKTSEQSEKVLGEISTCMLYVVETIIRSGLNFYWATWPNEDLLWPEGEQNFSLIYE